MSGGDVAQAAEERANSGPDLGELRAALQREEGGRRWLRRLAWVAGFALLLGVGVAWRVTHQPPPPARYVTRALDRGDVHEVVRATGAVQPVLQVTVGAQVNGRVLEVLVDYNSTVKKGDLLALLDPMVYSAQVGQTQANLAAQGAQIESARANLTAQRNAYERVQRLHAQNLASKGEVDSARGQFEVAQAQLSAAQAQVGALRAQLTQSKTNESFTKILSPVDGVVISRSIDPGATVVASFQAPSLFVLAQDLKQMRVIADVDEADVGKVQEGMQAEASVDAFPGEVFRGVVKQLRFSPTTTQGVVTYGAVVDVDNEQEKLRPGMTATVAVRTRSGQGALRVPNAALRFRPSPPKAEPARRTGEPLQKGDAASGGAAAQPANLPPLGAGEGRVYVLRSSEPGAEEIEPRVIQLGANDGSYTEVLAGLDGQEQVVTEESDAGDKKKKWGE